MTRVTFRICAFSYMTATLRRALACPRFHIHRSSVCERCIAVSKILLTSASTIPDEKLFNCDIDSIELSSIYHIPRYIVHLIVTLETCCLPCQSKTHYRVKTAKQANRFYPYLATQILLRHSWCLEDVFQKSKARSPAHISYERT